MVLLKDIKGIGQKRISLLNKLDIFEVSDLLTYFPRDYEDRKTIYSFYHAIREPHKKHLVKATIEAHDHFSFQRKKTLKIILNDTFQRASLLCYNRNFLKDKLPVGKEIFVFASFKYFMGEIQSSAFEILDVDELSSSLNIGRIVPLYGLTEGLTQNALRAVMYNALQEVVPTIGELLPPNILKKRSLMDRRTSLWNIHFPESYGKLEEAKLRLKYYEFFSLELQMALNKYLSKHTDKKKYSKLSIYNQFIESLPFPLTQGQLLSIDDIKSDLSSECLMNRLIQGDVGVGKTVVAVCSILMAFENKYQSVFMCPTELLAHQQSRSLQKYLEQFKIRVAFLSSSVKGKNRSGLLEDIKNGMYHVIVGTHALFSSDVQYNNLALAIIDEQHKFGVRERVKLLEKGTGVDLLIMTATPIPRTLSLTVYGDLDVSVIHDKPQRKAEIKSKCVFEDKRYEAVKFLDKQIEKGFQGYIVYPVIEESEIPNLNSAIQMYELITKDYLPHRKVGLIHGRLDDDEKERVMNEFIEGKLDVLVATTVIEVGIDVPKATVMIIENAERFGLSQLHQLRGRIGRSSNPSFCFFIVSKNITEDGKQRMRAIVNNHDGFSLSEEDLRLRGPGEFLGSKQSGLTNFKIANLIDDEKILNKAREDAFSIVKNDPFLISDENQIINKTIYKKFLQETSQYISG